MDEDEEELEGETLNSFIARLEALADTPQIRVPKEYTDKRGNILLPPTAIYLVDPDGTPHESASTTGQFVGSPYNAGAGGVRTIGGTFTKNATGSTGIIKIIPSADDILYVMNGWVVMGAARAGGADVLYAGIATDNGSSDRHVNFLYDSGADANEFFTFPGSGEAATAVNKTSPISTPLQAMVAGSSFFDNSDNSSSTYTQALFFIECQGMANTETFGAAVQFWSMTNTAPTTSAGAGTWA